MTTAASDPASIAPFLGDMQRRHTNTLSPVRRPDYADILTQIRTVSRAAPAEPNALARNHASRGLLLLTEGKLGKPRVVASAEAGIAFVFDGPSRHADFEFLNDGSVLFGMTDFEGVNVVVELDLNLPETFKSACEQAERFLT